MDRLPSGIKLRQLQYFLAVADTLHFSRAADEVAATQPTLSHQIAQLEQHLGSALFDRVGKKIRLTQAGSVLKDYTVRALKELEAGCGALLELEGLQRGTLRVGVIQSFSRALLPPILGAFVRDHPGINVFVEEMTADAIERRLAGGDLDLGIAFASLKLDDTEVEPLLQERLVLLANSAHPLAAYDTVAMRQLDGEPMALLASSFSTRRLIDNYLQAAGARPRIACETNSIEIMLGAVSQSLLSTIIPERAVRLADHPNLRAAALVDPVPVRSSALIWPRHSFRTAAARVFAGLVKESFAAG